MTVFDKIKDLIKECDYFEHPQLLRYRQEQSYRTLTGGFISLILIIVFAAVFTKLVINTFAKKIITNGLDTSIEENPSYFSTSTTISNRFMFAFGITGLDMNSKTNRFFNVIMQNRTYTKNGSATIQQKTNIPLVPCTKDQWTGISSAVDTVYDTVGLSQWLCPPTDFQFQFQGKFTSDVFKFVKISIQACTSSANVTCANASTIDNLITTNQGLQANLYFVNPLINAGNEKYLDYYLQDRDYFTFSKITGVSANIFFSQYDIDTDQSILPWTDTHLDNGAISTDPPQSQSFAVTNNQYGKIYLRKSSANLSYTRQFRKIDQTLAYIGGLLATILGLLLILKIYNKFSYQIQMGDQIFKENKVNSFGSEKFDFVIFMGYLFYNLLTKIGVYMKWKSMSRYNRCREQARKQLDIFLLFRKVEFFEHSLTVMLDEHHLKGLYLVNKPTIKEAIKKRKVYMLNQKINLQMERKAHQIFIEDNQFDKHAEMYAINHPSVEDQLNLDSGKLLREQDADEAQRKIKNKRQKATRRNHEKELFMKNYEVSSSLKNIRKNSHLGDTISKKIYQKLASQKSLSNLLEKDEKNIKSNKSVQNSNNKSNKVKGPQDEGKKANSYDNIKHIYEDSEKSPKGCW